VDDNFKAFLAEINEIYDLNSAAAVLGWDQQTNMPPGGAATRANQLSTLAKIIHERSTSAKMGEFLKAFEGRYENVDSFEGALVRHVRTRYERDRKLPTEFVAEISRAASISHHVWEEARRDNDFKTFAPHLEKMFDYARRTADFYGFDTHPYDALLFDYEPGLSAATIKQVFDELRQDTVDLVQRIAGAGDKADYGILTRDYDEEKQRVFAEEVARAFGYDFNRGRQDRAVHPFEINFSRDDVRITTRYSRNYLPEAMYGTMHETGHALYEQGTGEELQRTPLARGASMVVHESQSRTWENLVGRSRAFWQHWFPRLRELFPESLADVDAETMYKLVNRVSPSFIRVEADEVTYNLHIMLRFELELTLLEGKLKVTDLPEAWNGLFKDYLGLTPGDDREGVLQDVHWSGGAVAYFPTYALGNILSAQLFAAAEREKGDFTAAFAAGDYSGLLGWQREKIHRHGRKYLPEELILKATGEPLTAKYYVAYLKEKFGDIYGLQG
jgi:carboxypeptidase Taq